jgi:hypothetical protein
VSPTVCILSYKRDLRLKHGGVIVVVMDIFEITPVPRPGLFLDTYRLSWIAFTPEDPDRRVLMDSHPPIGIHYHVDSGEQIAIQLETVDQALRFFEKKVIEHFGEIEGSIYEDLYV